MVHVHLRQRQLPLIYLHPEVSSIKLYLPLLRSLVVCETPVSPSNMVLVELEVDSVAELNSYVVSILSDLWNSTLLISRIEEFYTIAAFDLHFSHRVI